MPKKIRTREDWLELGIKLLAQKGPSSLVIEKMAKSLNVSKTSFYWYFKSRKKYLLELANYWVSTQTDSVIEDGKKLKTDKEKLLRLAKIGFMNDHSLNPLHSWREIAMTDAAIAKIISKTEVQRIEYVQKLLTSEFGKKEAGYRAEILYHFFIGWLHRHRGMVVDDKQFKTLWLTVLKPIITNPSK